MKCPFIMAAVTTDRALPAVPGPEVKPIDDTSGGSTVLKLQIRCEPNYPGTKSENFTASKLSCNVRALIEKELFWYEMVELVHVGVRYTASAAGQHVQCGIVKSIYPDSIAMAGLSTGLATCSNSYNYGAMHVVSIFDTRSSVEKGNPLQSAGISTQVWPVPSNLAEPKLMFSCSAGVDAFLEVEFRIHGSIVRPIKMSSLPAGCVPKSSD